MKQQNIYTSPMARAMTCRVDIGDNDYLRPKWHISSKQELNIYESGSERKLYILAVYEEMSFDF
jgi:hypothetical protein